MIRRNAATSRGSAMELASGMKISAEPNPEILAPFPRPRLPQIVIAASMLISAGTSTAGFMRHHARSVPPGFFVTSAMIFAATASISWSVRVFLLG